jgi:hypothetical protein
MDRYVYQLTQVYIILQYNKYGAVPAETNSYAVRRPLDLKNENHL